MLSKIHQDVDQGVTDHARGGECARVVSLRPDSSATTESAIHRPRETDREAADATGEREPVGCFSDQMDVVVLYAELDDAEVVT